MAKRNSPNKTTPYKHESAKRKNPPAADTEAHLDDKERGPMPYTPDSRELSEDPVLAWQRKQGDSKWTEPRTYDAYPLYVREKVSPAAFVESLKMEPDSRQGELLGEDFNGYPDEVAHYQWYKHDINWVNRLIHGESAQVMASLAKREELVGRVQMIYFDPPYGISFKSNFQVDTENLRTGESRGDLPASPTAVTAFRDTYERGMHSYLDETLEKLTLCRSLLAESGSLFVQIGDENVMRMGLVCDEVFGPGNRVSLITYATSGGGSSKTLPSATNYLLWYARDKEQMKYRQVYEPLDRKGILESWTYAARVELPDGTTRGMTPAERKDPDTAIPPNCSLFQAQNLTSIGYSAERSQDYVWQGTTYSCPFNAQWRASEAGLDRLAELGRLDSSSRKKTLRWKWYEEEVPGRRINNIWHRAKATRDRRYVVQTNADIPARCIQMTTDPGDLVFDPTCGSGTTAVAAENLGRRWITCDTSPIAIAVTRQRLAASTFDYWTLQGTPDGITAEGEFAAAAGVEQDSGRPVPEADVKLADPASGFVYERVRYVSAGTLAKDEPPEYTMLVDQPHSTPGVVRLSSSFTVESPSPWIYRSLHGDDAPAEKAERGEDHIRFASRILEALRSHPIRVGVDGSADLGLEPVTAPDREAAPSESLHVVSVEPWPGSQISHRLTVTEKGGTERRAGLLIAPIDAVVSAAAIRRAVDDAVAQIDGAQQLFVIAYAFDPETAGTDRVGSVKVLRVQPHRDLMLEELAPDGNHQGFVLLGSPDLEVRGISADGAEVRLDGDGDPAESPVELVVEVLGFDTYNPSTGNAGVVEVAQGDKVINAAIKCWMIDTDYDGLSFFARRIHFPGSEGDSLVDELKKSLGRGLDKAAWDAMQSNRSAPFPLPKTGRIAVKVITSTGMEMTVTRDCPSV
ncbi:MAG TPA: hypothetical protein DEP66_07400 [Acidimicrobiaceae bacterium]|nr:hypothetical protein [Acidimicrobiaceae bacterium]